MIPKDVGTLTLERLRSFLSYDAETGIFTLLEVTRGHSYGKRLGHVEKRYGYRRVNIDGRHYMAHRLAWLYVHGEWPKDRIDHINGVRDDNRMSNLREATDRDNARNKKTNSNNKLGIKGVRVHEGGKYQARVKDKDKSFTSLHDTLEEAIEARRYRERVMFGSFVRGP